MVGWLAGILRIENKEKEEEGRPGSGMSAGGRASARLSPWMVENERTIL